MNEARLVDKLTTPDAPWRFRLAKYLIRHNLRGGHRLILHAQQNGSFNRVVRYSISPNVSFSVPLYRECNLWDREDVLSYETPLVDSLVNALAATRGNITFVDCGADIGIVSVRLAARCDRLKTIIAFEPNDAANEILRSNLEPLPMTTRVLLAAASDFTGHGELTSPAGDKSAHAMFIVASKDGPVDVRRVDDLDIPPGDVFAIKIDVEGSEANVIRGAAQTLRNASAWVVVFEAHPDVLGRTGKDPVETMKLLSGIGACTFELSDGPPVTLSLDRPFFDQVAERRVYNVVCRSTPARPANA